MDVFEASLTFDAGVSLRLVSLDLLQNRLSDMYQVPLLDLDVPIIKHFLSQR